MRTDKQREAARMNGAKSRGPKTEEGKQKSAHNSIKHGLLAKKIFLFDNENEEGFRHIVGLMLEQFEPATPLETELCIELAHFRWRLRRIWSIETGLMDQEMARQRDNGFKPADEELRIASAFEALGSKAGPLRLISQYESRLHRQFHRTYDRLLELQRDRNPEAVSTPTQPPEPTQNRACEQAATQSIQNRACEQAASEENPTNEPEPVVTPVDATPNSGIAARVRVLAVARVEALLQTFKSTSPFRNLSSTGITPSPGLAGLGTYFPANAGQ